MNILPRTLIIGHGRHGKDTVAEVLRSLYGFNYISSSEFCAEKLCYPALKDRYGYKDWEECFNDRHNHRAEWFDLIKNYCRDNPAQLGEDIFTVSDIYCGLRNKRELHALKNRGVYDVCIWVDRSDHLPNEPKSSMNLEPWMADFVIDNNSDRDALVLEVRSLFDNILSSIGIPDVSLKDVIYPE